MTDPAIGRVERRIRVHRRRVAARLGMSLALLLAFCAWFGWQGRDGWILGMSAALAIYSFAVWPLILASARGIAVEITDRGLVGRMGAIAFVGWDEIVDARLASTLGIQEIQLEVRDVEPVLQRISPVRRWFLRRYLDKHGGKLSLGASFMDADPAELLAIIRSRRRGEPASS